MFPGGTVRGIFQLYFLFTTSAAVYLELYLYTLYARDHFSMSRTELRAQAAVYIAVSKPSPTQAAHTGEQLSTASKGNKQTSKRSVKAVVRRASGGADARIGFSSHFSHTPSASKNRRNTSARTSKTNIRGSTPTAKSLVAAAARARAVAAAAAAAGATTTGLGKA